MTSHYPTTAELAAFRFAASPCRHQDRGRAPHGWQACGLTHPDRGAWPHEREHGIGYDYLRSDYLIPPMARREAARIRHAAFEDALFEVGAPAYAWAAYDWKECVETFAPGSYA